MQNWAHACQVFDELNGTPTQARDTDFSRVRSWYLDGDAAKLRQSVLLAAHPSAELAALARGCANVAGRTTTRPTYRGALARVPSGMRQLYVRFDADDPATAADARLRAFSARILPSIVRSLADGADGRTLLFVPSYLEFVRVQALLKGEGVPFAAVSEYSTPKEASRARTRLQQGQLPLLLYTERAHFFRRHRFPGAHNLALLAPPTYPHFYLELISMLEGGRRGADGGGGGGEGGGAGSVLVLCCRLDLPPLQRLVGSERAARMLTDEKSSFLFC